MTKDALIQAIINLKKERNAVILAHYYQNGDIQDIADFTGDSYALSVVASQTEADVIVFCGVHFMAETAKILAPEKTVLLPEKEAGCPMADMITASQLATYKKNHPATFVVCYVNSSAAVKALADICVTSSNAERIITRYKDRKILYVPDKNLGTWLGHRHNLAIDVWEGWCCIHNDLTVDLVASMQEKHPEAKFIVHPEAPLDVLLKADFVGSTKGLLDYVIASEHKTFLIGTEKGIIHQMEKHCPDKRFILLTENLVCNNMKITTLESLYLALKENRYVIEVEKDVQRDAKKTLDLMLELSR